VLVKEWLCVTIWSWVLYRVNQILVSNPVSKNDLIRHCLFSSFDKWPGNELDDSGVRFRARYFYHLPKFKTIFPQENTAGSWSWPSPRSSAEDKNIEAIRWNRTRSLGRSTDRAKDITWNLDFISVVVATGTEGVQASDARSWGSTRCVFVLHQWENANTKVAILRRGFGTSERKIVPHALAHR
jgi:hypothetical protein